MIQNQSINIRQISRNRSLRVALRDRSKWHITDFSITKMSL